MGTGNPWEGQSKVRLWPIKESNVLLLSPVGNFGPTLPTGSTFQLK
jgi:hypothetical protein